MAEVAVREVQASSKKLKCGNCDAPVEFDPTAGALKCAFCGSTQAIEVQGQVVEHSLHEASLAKHKGYGVSVRKLACDACGAQISFDPGVVAAKCAFCGSPRVAETKGEEGIRPESLLPFSVTPDQSSTLFNKWIKGLWFRPNDLKKLAAVKEIRGVYLPFWTYDADARSWWTAEAGHYYYVTESYTAVENGRNVTKTRQVRKIRWVHAHGNRRDVFDDELVYASKGLPRPMVQDIYPFDTSKLIPFAPEYLAGWGAEEAAFGAEEGWGVAKELMQKQQVDRCSKDVPGDTQRNLSVSTTFDGVTFKHAVLPIYVSAYAYKGKVFRFLVNGQTGKTDGEAPLSWAKIMLAVLAVLLVIGAIVVFSNANSQGGSGGSHSSPSTSSPSRPPSSPPKRR